MIALNAPHILQKIAGKTVISAQWDVSENMKFRETTQNHQQNTTNCCASEGFLGSIAVPIYWLDYSPNKIKELFWDHN